MKIHIVNILDASGSMLNSAQTTIDEFNKFIEEQKRIFKGDDAKVTLMTFSSDPWTNEQRFIWLLENEALENVRKISANEYKCGGMTPLRDAIGVTIGNITSAACPHCHLKCSQEKVIVCIATDGLENASAHYSNNDIKNLIENKKKDGWEFVYQGADHNIFEVVKDLHIPKQMTLPFKKSDAGIRKMYADRTTIISNYAGKI